MENEKKRLKPGVSKYAGRQNDLVWPSVSYDMYSNSQEWVCHFTIVWTILRPLRTLCELWVAREVNFLQKVALEEIWVWNPCCKKIVANTWDIVKWRNILRANPMKLFFNKCFESCDTLGQCFPTFFGWQHPHLIMMIFCGNRYKRQ